MCAMLLNEPQPVLNQYTNTTSDEVPNARDGGAYGSQSRTHDGVDLGSPIHWPEFATAAARTPVHNVSVLLLVLNFMSLFMSPQAEI